MSNLNNLTRGTNNEWALWVKLVKRAYKQKGHVLTQQQALMVAKQTYPGKGNVVMDSHTVDNIPVSDDIPENPVRRKKEPAPRKEAEVYQRERSPPRRRRVEYSDDEDSYSSPSPPRRRYKKKSRREETPSPPPAPRKRRV